MSVEPSLICAEERAEGGGGGGADEKRNLWWVLVVEFVEVCQEGCPAVSHVTQS